MSALVLSFGMPEDERRRLTGDSRDGNGGRRRGGRRRGDPMDVFTYVCAAMMVAVIAVYCVAMLRAEPGDDTSGPLQGLLAVIPIAMTLITLRGKDRNNGT